MNSEIISINGIKFMVSNHAKERYIERFTSGYTCDDNNQLEVELKDSIPFGAQAGNSIYYLSKDNQKVFVGLIEEGITVITTVLTIDQAVANMTWAGLISDEELYALRNLISQSSYKDRLKETEDDTKRQLDQLALEHSKTVLDKKQRNKILRDMGFDPTTKDGVYYRSRYIYYRSVEYRRVSEMLKDIGDLKQ